MLERAVVPFVLVTGTLAEVRRLLAYSVLTGRSFPLQGRSAATWQGFLMLSLSWHVPSGHHKKSRVLFHRFRWVTSQHPAIIPFDLTGHGARIGVQVTCCLLILDIEALAEKTKPSTKPEQCSKLYGRRRETISRQLSGFS